MRRRGSSVGRRDPSRARVARALCRLWLWPLPILLAVATGCSAHGDPRFSAGTNDEYKIPLRRALIGTPQGLQVVGTAVADPTPANADAGATPPPSDDGGSSSPGFGEWHFDDCDPASRSLADSSGSGATAIQALGAACTPGISGLGVRIRSTADLIQIPEAPQFDVSSRIAVAAWVKPDTVDGDQPIVLKRLDDETAFSLGLHGGNAEISVVLASGTTLVSRAPLAAGEWSHVAGMYDGTFLYLFINGQQFGQVYGGGALQNVTAPIRVGATTQTQHFDGVIDEVFVSTQAMTLTDLAALACVSQPATLTVGPSDGAAMSFGATAHYQVSGTNHDAGFCAPKVFDLAFGPIDSGVSATLDATSTAIANVPPGASVTYGIDVTSSTSADPGPHPVPVQVDVFQNAAPFSFQQLTAQLPYALALPTGCFVFNRREILITHTSVVDDPVRTFGVAVADGGFMFPPPPPPPSGVSPDDGGPNPSRGVWSFGHLMREMAPTADAAPAMTLALFQHWLTDQTVNGFTVAARADIQRLVIDAWPKSANGELDLDQSPLRLQAIVDRVDLRDLSRGSAGEGRFVFAVDGTGGFPQQFTVAVEYNLPAQTQADVLDWARRWHALSSHPFPSDEYNAALETVTRRFTDRGASPGSVNGSALLEIRTNETSLAPRWELRAFSLSASTGLFDEIPVAETPDLSFNGTSTLANFVNQNAAAIEAVVPGATAGSIPLHLATPPFSPFRAGAVYNDFLEWNAPGIADPEARFHQSINTCNGCHGPETNTSFVMLAPRSPGTETPLSPFLTGTTVADPLTGAARTLNDLDRRNADLVSLVCPSGGGGSADAGAP